MLVTKRGARDPLPEVFRLDLQEGGLERVAENSLDIRKWIADNAGRVRAAIGAAGDREPLRQALWYRADEQGPWKAVLDFDLQDLDVLGFQRDDRRLLVATRVARERFVIAELDPETGQVGAPLVDDPEYDAYHRGTSYLSRAMDGRPLFYQYMADKPRTVYFDAAWRERQWSIDALLKDTVNTIVGWSDDEQRFLVYAWSDRQPGRYYLFEPGAKRMEELLSSRGWLDPAAMHAMKPISFRSRDGLALHGYLTLPDESTEPPPVVVYAHGGPFGVRDSWGFDPDVQFLARAAMRSCR
jgi:dipeptidyl aminopeptidase/acylaminoacyl peptidase